MSDSSFINSIASMSMGMKAEDVQTQLSVAVMKQIKDQENLQLEMMTKLMESIPSADPLVGSTVNVTA